MKILTAIIACLLLPVIFFFLFSKKLNFNKITHPVDIANTEKKTEQSLAFSNNDVLTIKLSKGNAKNAIINWNNPTGSEGFVFVSSEDTNNKEKLFAAGKSGSSEANWIQEGKKYEFSFYGDAAKLKLITKILVVKINGSLNQMIIK